MVYERKITYVYLIKSGLSHLYKIGISADPQKRIMDMQTSTPEELHLIDNWEYGSKTAARKMELKLHMKYKDKRVKREWFELGKRDIISIKASNTHQQNMTPEKEYENFISNALHGHDDEVKDTLDSIKTNGKNTIGKTTLVKYLKKSKLTSKQAILSKCFECSGYFADGFMDCEIPTCPLYPHFPFHGR